MKAIVSLIVLAVILAGGAFWYWQTQAASGPSFRFAEVKRGRLVATVGSTGTLQPRETVDIGAQVAGPIVFIGPDPITQRGIVDWGSVVEGPVLDKDGTVVKKGTVLAQIDPAIYAAQANSAAASVKAAQADLLQKTATLHQATADWNRAQSLFKTAGVAQAEYDQYKATFEVAQANVEVSKANIGVAKANLKTAETNLNYTTICSPVNGTVIDRRVNVGQTVVASLSAPSLFLIAKDLKQMEVWATVNEVDVLRVKAGQDVNFTVDAYPGRIFKGKVVPQGKLPFRLNATMNNNVVTYTAVVSVDNSDDSLRPYLTANLNFIVGDKKDVLLVPNAALRWQPSKRQMSPEVQDAYNRQRGKKRVPGEEGQEHGFVWVPGPNGLATFIEVITGLSDAVNSELVSVVGGVDLPERSALISGEGRAEAQSGGGASPFVGTPFGNKKKE
jgi:HlyD family secretion protein